MERILVIEKDPNIFEKVYEWFLIPLLETSVKRGIETYTGQDIVVINVEIEAGWDQIKAIEHMAKKSKVVIVSSALLYTSQRDFHLYIEENSDNIIVAGNEEEAIQKVLDCLKE